MANFCSNCGKSLRENARFCPYCGTKVFNVTLNNSTQSSGASSYEKDKVENGDKESKVVAGKTKWVCRICGYVHEGDEPPAICPLCKNPSTYFEKVVEATPTQASSVATKRVYQVAKELNCDEQKVIDFLKNQGIKVVNRLSVVSEDNYKLLQKKFLEDLLFGALMNGGNDSNSSSPSEKSTDIKASESNAISSIVPADEAISSPKIVEANDLNRIDLKKAGFEAEYNEDYSTAVKYYEKANDAESYYRLGEIFRYEDRLKAFRYYERSISHGDYFLAVLGMSSLIYDQETFAQMKRTLNFGFKMRELSGKKDTSLNEREQKMLQDIQEQEDLIERLTDFLHYYLKKSLVNDSFLNSNYILSSSVCDSFVLGVFFYDDKISRGLGFEVDSSKYFNYVIDYCRKVVDDNIGAMCLLARMYFEGWGVSEDKTISLKLYMKAIEFSKQEAVFLLGTLPLHELTPDLTIEVAYYGMGDIYLNVADAFANTRGWGKTVSLDMDTAMKWYKKAADLGSIQAMSTLKHYEEKRLEYEEACVGANQGNYKSMITLAKMYISGRVVTRNKKEALNLYLRAASLAKPFKSFKRNSDYGETAYRIAEIYCEGDDDVEQDYYEAKKWYVEAVRDGNFHAMEKLAEMFRTGTGGRKDSSHADYILKVKEEFFDAHAGIIEAQYKVAYRYWNGDFVKEDYNKAVAWFREIAENKNIDELDLKYKYGALYNMAILYDEGGYGLEIDKRKASLLREEAKKYEKYRSGKSNSSNTDSSKGGCFITTAACLNLGGTDDCYELTTFRFFRDNWLVNQPDGKSLIAEYYSIAPKIVDKIDSLRNAQEIYRQIWDDYLKPCLSLIEQAKYSECKLKYIDMVNYLKKI